MKMRMEICSLVQAVVISALFSWGVAYSQQFTATQETRPTLELTYDFVRTNGPPNNCGCINLNGGGIAYVHPLGGSQFSLVGSVRAGHAGEIGLPGYDLTLMTYTGGVRYLPRVRSFLIHPYGEIQVGGAHASGTLAGTPSLAGASIGSAFAATAGGGINLVLHSRVSFKLIDAEYLATNYANGSTDHQNDLRLSTGLIISLCRSNTCATAK